MLGWPEETAMNQTTPLISFASDNHAGVHPKVFESLLRVNAGFAPAYGGDVITETCLQKFQELFGADTESFLVWNGTAANVLGLKAMLRTHQSVICTDLAHIHLDECGAPEQHTGSKLIPLVSTHAKLSVEQLQAHFERVGDVQAVQPKVISISQTTEYGTCYTLDEIQNLAAFAHARGAYLHMDGARAANAAVSLNCSLAAMTKAAGVDVLSFGGTKNGLMGAEAVVFLNSALAADFKYTRKQGLHLASKMRFISAQFLAYFENDLWQKNAEHANRMAQLLKTKLSPLAEKIKITHPVDANVIFATLPRPAIENLQKQFYFYTWNETLNEVRWMCSFETTEAQVEKFARAIQTEISG
jgi:threonine aldolase